MGKPVTQFQIVAKDPDKAATFYGKLFGWSIDTNNPMQYGMVESAGEGIGGGIGKEDVPLVTFYVAVDDPAATLEKLVALGAKVVMPPQDVPGGPTIARFSDPAGNVLGLVKAQP